MPTSRVRRPPRHFAWVLLPTLALLAGLTGCDQQARAVDGREIVFENQNFRVVSIDLKRESLSLHWKEPESGEPFGTINSLRQWGLSHGRRMLFAANAGIYDRQYAPLGLYVENGRTVVPLNLAHGNPASGNFSLLPNGVFAVYPDGHAAVRTSAAFKAEARPVQWASQSGPMLVIDGKLNDQFIDDSNSLKWRSGVCARTSHQVVFAVSEAPVNFHTFARLFKEQLGCHDALYLDGTISQFYVDGEGYAGAPTFMVKPYAGIFAVFAQPTP
ncbi:MAG TPA: phosphodiester glycosidase family protein [Dyella sp.]|uniref:phosphodiester glycosidase family protein n=1 Tax=Dyella sp. TaxID=1869338 RepID=UPI002D7A31DF|nr:phosphodiester glycosidase family protein [Dyella sp.]HET6554495.1 phosphodiester glycosidase family protein [Dyella sp.]